MRYSDRDCWSAIVRTAAALNQLRPDADKIGIEFRSSAKWAKNILELADAYAVPVRRWKSESDTGPRIGLEHVPGCYGGGVRPYMCSAGQTGHDTIRWWTPSAGLGPAGVPRREFCHILGAVEEVLR